MRSVKMSKLTCDVDSFLAQKLLCIIEGKISFINKQYNFVSTTLETTYNTHEVTKPCKTTEPCETTETCETTQKLTLGVGSVELGYP